MNTNHKAVVAALKATYTNASFSTSPRKGGKAHWAVKISSTATSKAEIEELCATNETFLGWSFFTSRDGSTHGVMAMVDVVAE